MSQVEVNCTDSELANFVERSLSFQWRPVADDANAPTDTGKVMCCTRNNHTMIHITLLNVHFVVPVRV